MEKENKNIPLSTAPEDQLRQRAQLFLDALTGENYDDILSLTYPGIYEIVPKEFMREKIIQSFNGDETKVTMDLFEINSIGKIFEHDAGNYAKIDYTMLMAIQFVKKEKDPKKEKEFKEFMLNILKAQFGDENLWHEPTTDAYSYHQQKSMVGIQDQLSPDWTFLNYQPGELMERFIPSDIRLLIEMDMPD
jgi:hypothetical protein